MKKAFASVCIAGVAPAMSSYRLVGKAIPLSSISGEQDIIEINDSEITPGESRSLPPTAFDVVTSCMSSNSDCNRMVGSFGINAGPGNLEFTGMANARMICPGMTTENNVLNALTQVKGYKEAGKDRAYLYSSSNRPAVVLQKREADMKLSVLNGEWRIKEVNGEATPSGTEEQSFIAFDVEEETIYGNTGRSLINGGLEAGTSNAESVSFSRVASIMTACSDMETEGKVLEAINEVKLFDVLFGSGIGLYDTNDALVIVPGKQQID